MLKQSEIMVNKVHPGIYRFEGKLSLPVQLVVSSQLSSSEYDGLKLLAKGVTEEDITSYAEKAKASGDQAIKNNAGTVIDVCLNVNKNLKGAKEMYEGFKEFFKDFIEEERQEERQEGRQEGTERANERVVTNMLKKNFPLSLIEEISQLSEDAIRGIAGKFGIAVI